MGEARAEPRPKIVPAGHGAKGPRALIRVNYSLGGAHGAVASAGLGVGCNFMKVLARPGGRRIVKPDQK